MTKRMVDFYLDRQKMMMHSATVTIRRVERDVVGIRVGWGQASYDVRCFQKKKICY